MPEITYILRFAHCRPDLEVEVQEHTNAHEAWEAFRLFAEPDSFEIYRWVTLVEYNWQEHQEYPLARLTFQD